MKTPTRPAVVLATFPVSTSCCAPEPARWPASFRLATMTVELSSNALPDGRLRGFARDISERKQAEGAIRRGEESLARAQSVAHVGSFDWDVRTGAAERSAELCALFGLGPEGENAPPWTLSEIIHPDDREAVLGARARARTRSCAA